MKRQFLFTMCVILALVFGYANVSPALAAAPYTLTDLGTLGGSYSYAIAINDAGQVIGHASLANGIFHGFVWESGKMTDLGTLGGSYSSPRAINEAGQVIGDSYLAGNASYHAFVWEDGVMTDLGTLGGDSFPVAINEAGQVIGYSWLPSIGSLHAFVWEGGVLTDLGTFGGNLTYSVANNEVGQVIGDSSLANGSLHAFVWEGGVMTDLGTLGGSNSQAVAINKAGQVIGYSAITGNTSVHAFMWEDGKMTDLGTLGGSSSRPVAINDAGQVIGHSTLANGNSHAFVWEGGMMTDLGTLGGSYSRPVAINEAGQVIGDSYLANGYNNAFVWEGGVMTDLGTLGGSSSSPRAINDAGQVIGHSTLANGNSHAFVWEGGMMTDLGTLGGSSSSDVAINEAGQVIGTSSLAGITGVHAFVTRSVTNQPPTASIGGPYSVDEGASVTVTASGSDPENGTLTYAWDLDNNGTFETPGQSVTFSALDGPSTYTITVQVTDEGGLAATGSTTVDVLNVAPTADFTSTPSTLFVGQSATLAFSNPSDPSAADTTTGFQYSYDCTNDGSFELESSSDASYICGYLNSGTFNALGRIADKDGDFTDYTVQVTVQTPSEGTQGLIEQVQSLVAQGTLSEGNGNALIAKLDGVIKQLEKGKTKTAVNELQAFISQVNDFMNSTPPILLPSEGQPLIDAANAIIAALES